MEMGFLSAKKEKLLRLIIYSKTYLKLNSKAMTILLKP